MHRGVGARGVSEILFFYATIDAKDSNLVNLVIF